MPYFKILYDALKKLPPCNGMNNSKFFKLIWTLITLIDVLYIEFSVVLLVEEGNWKRWATSAPDIAASLLLARLRSSEPGSRITNK